MGATAGTTTRVFTISSGQSLSAEVDVEGYKIAAISMSAGWDAANLTFQAATASGGTFQEVHDDAGAAVTVTAAAARMIGLDAVLPDLSALRFLKIRSGTVGAPVNQTADRTLTLVLKA